MKKYLVGGAVRDQMMGVLPKDHDYVIVGATQEDVNHLIYQGYTQVGADFPVFLHPETGEEYALARVERKTGTGYHGFMVTADEHVTIEEDLARRDLTINSMAIELDGALVDPYGGIHDLRNRILRHTSPAFSEDPLRVLRLARFAARFKDFKIADETVELCQALCWSGELEHLSIERIWIEMEKGFSENSPGRFLAVMRKLGAIKHCLVLRDIFGEDTEGQHAIASKLDAVGPSRRLVIAIATLARSESLLPGANNRVRDCFNNTKILQELPRTATALAGFMKRSRAYQEGPSFDDVSTSALVLEAAGYPPTFTVKRLGTARRVASEINAAQFPVVTGKELGAAIEQGRVQALSSALAIPI